MWCRVGNTASQYPSTILKIDHISMYMCVCVCVFVHIYIHMYIYTTMGYIFVCDVDQPNYTVIFSCWNLKRTSKDRLALRHNTDSREVQQLVKGREKKDPCNNILSKVWQKLTSASVDTANFALLTEFTQYTCGKPCLFWTSSSEISRQMLFLRYSTVCGFVLYTFPFTLSRK
jgi:hypothetical protein